MIKIFGIEYKVECCDSSTDMGDRLGTYSLKDQMIRIANNQKEQVTESCILHELCHAISCQLDLELTEHQVRGLETGLYAFCSENGIKLNLLDKVDKK